MRIYLDVCCLHRPLDDQSQERIRMESEAVELTLKLCAQGIHQWVAGEVVDDEVSQNPDPDQRSVVQGLLRSADERLVLDDAVRNLARSYVAQGIAGMDALHLASAEIGGCEVFLTTDDRLLKRSARLRPALRVRVENPARWIVEVLQDGA